MRENSVFEIHNELLRLRDCGGAGSATQLHPVIADIRSAERLRPCSLRINPRIVFHSAAHKHVPLMEDIPPKRLPTISRNWNCWKSGAQGVERFVMISTDKAVRPTSVMGASKRVAELLVHRAGRADREPMWPCALATSWAAGAAWCRPSAADRSRGAGDRHPSRGDTLLHDDGRGGATRPAGRDAWPGWRSVSCSTWASRFKIVAYPAPAI